MDAATHDRFVYSVYATDMSAVGQPEIVRRVAVVRRSGADYVSVGPFDRSRNGAIYR